MKALLYIGFFSGYVNSFCNESLLNVINCGVVNSFLVLINSAQVTSAILYLLFSPF